MQSIMKRIITNTLTRVCVSVLLAIIFAVGAHVAKAASTAIEHEFTNSALMIAACNSASGTTMCSGTTSMQAAWLTYVTIVSGTGDKMWCSYTYAAHAAVKTCGSNPDTYTLGDYTLHYYDLVTACPAGFTPDATTGECLEDEAPPPFDCGIGYANVDGGSGIESCAPVVAPIDQGCDSVQGYINGVEICMDDMSECEDTGGAFGWINDKAVCIASAEDVEEANCSPGSFAFYGPSAGWDSMVCVSPTDPTPDPDTETPPSTPDSDADGTPNDADPDDDNDGIADGDDGGAGQCDPTAFNYFECAGLTDQTSQAEGDAIGKVALAKGVTALDAAVESVIDSANENTGTTTVIGAGPSGDEGLPAQFAVGSCADMSYTWGDHGTMVIECDRFEPMRNLLAFAAAIYTIFACMNMAFAAGKSKV